MVARYPNTAVTPIPAKNPAFSELPQPINRLVNGVAMASSDDCKIYPANEHDKQTIICSLNCGKGST